MSEEIKEAKKRGRKKKSEGNTEEIENIKKEIFSEEVKEVKKRGRKPKTEKQKELKTLEKVEEVEIAKKDKKREEIIKSVATKAAKKVKIYGRTIKLHPMNPYERRIVHFTLQNFDGVETYSEGREPFRRVVIDVKK